MRNIKDKANLGKSELVKAMPVICSDETAAVEFFEEQLWKGEPKCAHCHSKKVYQMKDAKTGQRNKKFLWRCHNCKKQFTVRIGTVLEESRLPLRHWAYAFWRAATSKKGVSALEIMRQCQISYPSALFLMHRIREAMTPEQGKLKGIVECDETYLGGKVRGPRPKYRRNWRKEKTPVFGMAERGGKIHRRVVADVTGRNLRDAIKECVHEDATISTDAFRGYRGIGKHFRGGHLTVNHNLNQYVDGNASTNTAESSFALLKRGLHGIYHAVSRKHLPRYLGEFDFRWNTRKLNDGDRTVAAIQGAKGKRLDYKTLVE